MLIPFSHEPTAEERYRFKKQRSIDKAKTLAIRMKTFLSDLHGAGRFKEKDIREIKCAALSFLLSDVQEYTDKSVKNKTAKEEMQIRALVSGLMDVFTSGAK